MSHSSNLETDNISQQALNIRPVVVRSATDIVHSELLKSILSGKLKPGSLLRQNELAAQLGVSRTPLREALMRLASIGLVNIESNRGARVADMDFGNMQQAWTSRMIIESGAARIAADIKDAEMIEKMQQIIKRQYEVIDDDQESLILNREFHLSLVQLSKNPYLIKFSEMLWDLQIAFPILRRQMTSREELLSWADDHQKILDAIVQGKGDLASNLIQEHILANPPLS
jgi:DNA-binding GntR family transcriptional regulator